MSEVRRCRLPLADIAPPAVHKRDCCFWSYFKARCPGRNRVFHYMFPARPGFRTEVWNCWPASWKGSNTRPIPTRPKSKFALLWYPYFYGWLNFQVLGIVETRMNQKIKQVARVVIAIALGYNFAMLTALAEHGNERSIKSDLTSFNVFFLAGSVGLLVFKFILWAFSKSGSDCNQDSKNT